MFHIGTHQLGALSVKASEDNGSHHDGDIIAETLEKAGALEGDVGGAHDERLPGSVGQRKEVVRGDRVLTGTFHFYRVLGSLAGGNEKVF